VVDSCLALDSYRDLRDLRYAETAISRQFFGSSHGRVNGRGHNSVTCAPAAELGTEFGRSRHLEEGATEEAEGWAIGMNRAPGQDAPGVGGGDFLLSGCENPRKESSGRVIGPSRRYILSPPRGNARK
jgi:hypothetical protein